MFSRLKWAAFLISSIFALGLKPLYSHCQFKPEVTLNAVSDGVSEQVQCLFQSTCVRDTFYRDTLFQELLAQWDTHAYAVAGVIDSLTYRRFPLFNPQDSTDIWDTLRTEKVWIRITDHLKGNFSSDSLVLDDFWSSFNELPPIATYDSVIGTPFIAFFDSADSMKRLGLGPLDGCFFEPTGYYVINKCIIKLGDRWLSGDRGRLPGVSVRLEDFSDAVGLNGINTATTTGKFKPWPSPILKLKINRMTTSITISPAPFQMSIYNVKGYLLSSERIDPRKNLNLRVEHLPTGAYWVHLRGEGWENAAPLVIRGRQTFLDARFLPENINNTGCFHDIP